MSRRAAIEVDKKSLGHVKARRKDLGVTCREIADYVGITETSYRRIEAGTQATTLVNWKYIAAYLEAEFIPPKPARLKL